MIELTCPFCESRASLILPRDLPEGVILCGSCREATIYDGHILRKPTAQESFEIDCSLEVAQARLAAERLERVLFLDKVLAETIRTLAKR